MAAQDSNDLKLRLERSGSVYHVQGSDGTTLASPAVGTLQELLHPSIAKSHAGDWTSEDAESISRQLREIIFQNGFPGNLIPSSREATSPGATPRLLLDLEGVEELENLPWELLARPETTGGVCLVRSVPSAGRPPAHLQAEPFRVLSIIASPADMPPFDFDWQLGGTAWSFVERLEEPSEACLRQTVSAQHFQVLHFVGYGRSNAEARYGILFLEGQDRHSRGITAEYFASILSQRQQTMPRLVILEAGSSAAEPNPFAETARVLVRKGIGSVVAMRRRLSGLATMTFRQELYGALAAGSSIEQSMVNARRALWQRCMDVEWDAPMLYSSSEDDGMIPTVRPSPIERPRDATPPPAQTPMHNADSAGFNSIQRPETLGKSTGPEGKAKGSPKARLRKATGKVKKILILAASPEGLARLRLGEEMRDIEEGLRRASYRDRFQIEQRSAVRPLDLQQAMLDVEPQIVHFCGHGAGAEGLILEDDNGQPSPVPSFALANLFGLFANQVECVVLNSCHSEHQANAISEHIRYVVGMKKQIGDQAAINFAIGFYCALGAGRPVEFAYQMGCSAIELENLPGSLVPVLLARPAPGLV